MRSVLQGMLGKIHYANVLHALFSLRLVALKKKNVVLFLWTKTFNNNNKKKMQSAWIQYPNFYGLFYGI